MREKKDSEKSQFQRKLLKRFQIQQIKRFSHTKQIPFTEEEKKSKQPTPSEIKERGQFQLFAKKIT